MKESVVRVRAGGNAAPAWSVAAVLALALVLVPATTRADESGALDRLNGLIRKAEASFAALRGYRCVILMQERPGGKPRGLETIRCAFRKPNSVALEWLKGPFQGLRVSYVEGRDADGMFLGREAGFAGIVGVQRYKFAGHFVQTFYPHRFSPAQTNVGFTIALMARIFHRAVALNKIRVTGESRAASPYLKSEMIRFEVVLSPDPADGLEYGRALAFFDPATSLPLHVELYDFHDRLAGLYVFSQFQPDDAIQDSAFEIR
jgi:hypothetical protein